MRHGVHSMHKPMLYWTRSYSLVRLKNWLTFNSPKYYPKDSYTGFVSLFHVVDYPSIPLVCIVSDVAVVFMMFGV